MIFVTVGTQIPFDRMIRTIDQWAGTQSGQDIFAQIGPGAYEPRHMKWSEFVDAAEFRRLVAAADVIIAHAGMGSIITALELGKPIIVMPRRAALREHRNDHQLATARQFLAQGRINVAIDENELLERLNNLQAIYDRQPISKASTTASPELIHALRAFIRGETPSSIPVGRIPVPIIESAAEVSRDAVLEQPLLR